MSPRRRKILGYFAMFLTIDVLIASILGLILMWVSFTAAGNVLDHAIHPVPPMVYPREWAKVLFVSSRLTAMVSSQRQCG